MQTIKKHHVKYHQIIYLTLNILLCSRTSMGQSYQDTYPRMAGYFSILIPAATYNGQGVTANFFNGMNIGFPMGINFIRNEKFGVSFEMAPTIHSQNNISKVSSVLFDPGAMLRFKHGFAFTTRLAFETSGRYGFSFVFNQVIKRNRDSNFFLAIPVPLRFGNSQPASIGAGLLVGVGF